MADRPEFEVRNEPSEARTPKKVYEPPKILYQGDMERIAGACGKTAADPDNCAILGPALS